MSSEAGFFNPKAYLAFTQFRKVFTKALILYHFDLKRYIRIKIDALGYAIGEVLSQLDFEMGLVGQVTYKSNLLSKIGQWHLVTFFSRKMIPVETR